MTRQEEIKNKAIEKSAEYRFGQFYSYNNDVYSGFIQGAEWADKNQPSPWIKIEDDLPCNHKELLNKDDPRYTVPVLIKRHNVTNGEIRYVETVMTIYCSKEWIWMDVNAKHKVTHWMPIPNIEENETN